jgi:hypothetical protein
LNGRVLVVDDEVLVCEEVTVLLQSGRQLNSPLKNSWRFLAVFGGMTRLENFKSQVPSYSGLLDHSTAS